MREKRRYVDHGCGGNHARNQIRPSAFNGLVPWSQSNPPSAPEVTAASFFCPIVVHKKGAPKFEGAQAQGGMVLVDSTTSATESVHSICGLFV
jgi:hypothetical protein